MNGMTPRRIRTRLPLDQLRETKPRIELDFEINRALRKLKAFDPYAITRLRWLLKATDSERSVRDITTAEKMVAL